MKTAHSRGDFSDGALLLGHGDDDDSPLEQFFQLSAAIRRDISDLKASFDVLLRKRKECFRPTFTDPVDSISDVTAMTSSMNVKMQDIQGRIGYFTLSCPEFPDRERIVRNLKQLLMETFREFSVKFKLEQQTFAASLDRRDKRKQGKELVKSSVDFDSLNFGPIESEQRQMQLHQQRADQEIEQIAQRSAEIRNIFASLQTLIVEQGTVVDRIDYCITESLTNAVEAEHQVRQAASYQQKSRLWIIAVVLVVLIVILFIMAICK